MSDKKLKKELELAFYAEMGRVAFAKGMKCIPAQDKNIMSAIADTEKRTIPTVKALKSWIAGWTQANLEA